MASSLVAVAVGAVVRSGEPVVVESAVVVAAVVDAGADADDDDEEEEDVDDVEDDEEEEDDEVDESAVLVGVLVDTGGKLMGDPLAVGVRFDAVMTVCVGTMAPGSPAHMKKVLETSVSTLC